MHGLGMPRTAQPNPQSIISPLSSAGFGVVRVSSLLEVPSCYLPGAKEVFISVVRPPGVALEVGINSGLEGSL